MRKIVAISMPDEMHEHLRRSVLKTRYGSVSEYIRELIRHDQERASRGGQEQELSDDESVERKPLFDLEPINEMLDRVRRERLGRSASAASQGEPERNIGSAA